MKSFFWKMNVTTGRPKVTFSMWRENADFQVSKVTAFGKRRGLGTFTKFKPLSLFPSQCHHHHHQLFTDLHGHNQKSSKSKYFLFSCKLCSDTKYKITMVRMLIMKFWPLNLLTYYNYFREFLTDGHFAVFICLSSTFSLNSLSLILNCWHFCNHLLCNRGLWNTWKNLYKTFWWGWFDFNSDIVSVYIISNMILTILIILTIWIMLMTIIWWILARAAPYPTRLPN